jgi:hypothetical protein
VEGNELSARGVVDDELGCWHGSVVNQPPLGGLGAKARRRRADDAVTHRRAALRIVWWVTRVPRCNPPYDWLASHGRPSPPRGVPRDSKSAFTRVCDALCIAGTPLRASIFQRR